MALALVVTLIVLSLFLAAEPGPSKRQRKAAYRRATRLEAWYLLLEPDDRPGVAWDRVFMGCPKTVDAVAILNAFSAGDLDAAKSMAAAWHAAIASLN